MSFPLKPPPPGPAQPPLKRPSNALEFSKLLDSAKNVKQNKANISLEEMQKNPDFQARSATQLYFTIKDVHALVMKSCEDPKSTQELLDHFEKRRR